MPSGTKCYWFTTYVRCVFFTSAYIYIYIYIYDVKFSSFKGVGNVFKDNVILKLFRSFCTSFYFCYLWTAYKKSTFDKLRVAFNNAYRRVLNLPLRCSVGAMYANFRIKTFEPVIGKFTYGFTQRLDKNKNSLIMDVVKSWIVRINR